MKKLLLLLFFPSLALANGEVISPNMNLVVPQANITNGPQWAADLVMSLGIIDSHNHTPGNGVQIPTAGLNINSELSCNGNAVVGVDGLALIAGSPPAFTSIYTNGTDLFFEDSHSNPIRITQNGGVVGPSGSISGLVSPASASYVSANATFVWQSAANTAADLDAGCLLQRDLTSSSNAITLCPPASLAANYSLTWMASLPASQSLVTIDNSGNIATGTFSPANLVPSGAMLPYGGTSAPSGYLLCDGTSYLRATYAALFSAIGTAYGTADSTHFNVPDLRGQFLRGVTGGSANDPNASTRTAMNSGGNTGNNVGSVQSGATAVNGLSATASIGAGVFPNFISVASGTGGSTYHTYNLTNTTAPLSPQPTISLSGDSETRPINAYVTYIIKY